MFSQMLRMLSLGLLYFTAHLVCLVSSQECYEESRLGEPPSQNCDTMSQFCSVFQVQNIGKSIVITIILTVLSKLNIFSVELLLKGTGTLTCTIGVSTPTFSIRRTSCNSGVREIIENGANYTVNGNTLNILSADRETEGEYFCSRDDASITDSVYIGCVYVSGK